MTWRDETEPERVLAGWVEEVWTPAIFGLTALTDHIDLDASYEEWTILVNAIRHFAGKPPEPERHFGTFHIVQGGGWLGGDDDE